MESSTNGTVENVVKDVTGTRNDFSPSDANAETAGDSDVVDSHLLNSLGKLCSEPKEKPKIYVHQCKDEYYYNMNHRRRGLAVIFNHEDFDSHLNLKKRNGTNLDRDNLGETLSSLGFEVIVHNNLRLKSLLSELDKLAETDYEDCDCLLIIILSHGVGQGLIYASNGLYNACKLFDRFTPEKCPSLAGKPKIFLIQACRGDKLDDGFDVDYQDYDELDAGITSYRMPSYVDFLFAYCTIPGHYSWRNPIQGSWFIQAFCEEMNEHWQNQDVQTILTFVNRRVAFDFESNNPEKEWLHRKKQTSTFTSQLTRILKFPPKIVKKNETVE